MNKYFIFCLHLTFLAHFYICLTAKQRKNRREEKEWDRKITLLPTHVLSTIAEWNLKVCQLTWRPLGTARHGLPHCYKTLRRIPQPWPDGAGPNGQGRGKWWLYIYDPGISLLRYLYFPAFFQVMEFSGNLHDHLSGEFLSYAGILQSSMPEDSSGIFRRFTLWNQKVHSVVSKSCPKECYSSPLPLSLHHEYLPWKSTKYKLFFFIYSTSCAHDQRMSEFATKNKR